MITILILTLLLIFFFRGKEMFTVVPGNAFDIPNDTIDNLGDEINKKRDVFREYNNNVKRSDIPEAQFIETPYYIDKNDTNNLNGLIKNLLIDKINSIKVEGKLDLVRDIYNIKWRRGSNGNDIEILFNIDLVNPSKFYVVPLFMYIKVNLEKRDPDSFELIYIEVDDTLEKKSTFNIKPYIRTDSYYRIKNHLYLFDPYLTSGKEMEIKR